MKLTTLLPFSAWALLAASAVTAQDPPNAPDAKPVPVERVTPDRAVDAADAKDEKKKEVPLRVGSTIAKDVTATDVDGETFKFEDARGKPVVLHFWSTTCPYEEAAEPKLMKIAKDYKNKALVIAVNANKGEIGSKPDAAAFEAEKEKDRPYQAIRKHASSVEFNHRILIDHDGKLATLLEGKTTPHCFVFDGEGVLRYQGALDDDPRDKKGAEAAQYVRTALDAVLAGKDVETETTRPYG